MDRALLDEAAFKKYLAHLRNGWDTFIDVLGENCALAPFFTQVFPGTALGLAPFRLFGERIDRAALGDVHSAGRVAELYAFGENFASPAFQGRSPGEFRTLLGRFYEIWEEINGEASASLRKRFGVTVNPSAARLLNKKIRRSCPDLKL